MFGFIRKQFIDVIEWPNPGDDTLMWRFPAEDQEIQTGATLVVRESQQALFVDEGKTADLFGAGTHLLTTQTLPLLTNLKNWDKFFASPFKSDVYFFNLRQQLGRRWGTAQPVTVRDSEFGVVQLRAFGMYDYRISDPAKLFSEVTGVVAQYSREALDEPLRNVVMTRLASVFGSSGIAFLDMAANQVLLSQKMAELLAPDFARLGLTLERFSVESVTLPEAIQKALDERISMGVVGDLNRYTQYQAASAIPLAAQNEGGLAGIGAGVGVGAAIGQAMATNMNAAPAAAPQTTGNNDPQARLAQLKALLDQGLITAEDYEKAKAEVLKQLIG
ncbi:Putative virion core protein (lumpy skin disease virus) [Cardiobacterium hominis]|uniref:SPFH/Band 7/PHB domain protein n=1 Tax=Cardiobacterium hominis (strain ATCC 15826 / DSM 8339 / NCTC 10426 / 6573) TaxID=638300 RepID=C8NBD2_CARH6|nr:SPFH domain-containing protein [Cardiobacterium hominis]EEV88100.1 SPFH/Band 7/PHB domain protein [Cardiobacterium hominis ATCC 15826]VEG77872.1 Putative virion core protein (lumpy skin disease virus) [Cardiobacterium hominis]